MVDYLYYNTSFTYVFQGFFKNWGEKVSTVGIIAEFNPLHTGHAYLLSKARQLGSVVCVISGNFVQRGDVAVVSKEVRAKSALLCGADLVAELPVFWSMSTAQNFALGGVSALVSLGCDTLLFGSECGEIEPLLKIADILKTEEFSNELNRRLNSGITFAKARQEAVEHLGGEKGILEGPNNNLGIEYIIAARSLGADLTFKTIKRRGADHNSRDIKEFVSATLLREALQNGDTKLSADYIPQSIRYLYENTANIKKLDTAVMAALRLKTKEELKALPDLSEGMENKLFSSIRVATTPEELYNTLKVKRYPMSRIRRLVLSAFLGFNSSFFMKPLPYVRILGINSEGERLLRLAKKSSPIPVITRIGELETLDSNSKRVFAAECRATDIFNLALKNPQQCGTEYTFKLIREE